MVSGGRFPHGKIPSCGAASSGVSRTTMKHTVPQALVRNTDAFDAGIPELFYPAVLFRWTGIIRENPIRGIDHPRKNSHQ